MERIKEYMLKAVREAKVHSSWLTPNATYEDGLARFIDGVLGPSGSGKFLSVFLPFQQRIAALGVTNSLAQVVLKVGSPACRTSTRNRNVGSVAGGPRQPSAVDFELRDRLLRQLDEAGPRRFPTWSPTGRTDASNSL